ncbi:MAG: Saccharopine dehydrogenase binding domain, partial [Mycobacterium sp.]|nr:Saccharopine dehydrogenase binding domain [Mycobacterium sp.]
MVVSCVGPYSELGWQVAQATLDAGAHYVDVSGEPEW